MSDLPAPVQAYVAMCLLATRSPAYVLVRQDGRLDDWGGDLALYGMTDLQYGIEIGRQTYVLEGLLPLAATPLCVPCIETASGLFADIHIFPAEAGAWVLFLDATVEAVQRRLLQQKAHEMILLQEHYTTIFGRPLGQEITHNPVRFVRGAMMTASLLAQTFTALDTVVMEHMAEGAFRLLSTVPAWFAHLYPEVNAQQEGLRPGDVFPFLENFLIDAAQFWHAQGTGQLKSGPWSEMDVTGNEYDLEASAMCLGSHQILCMAFPKIEFAEKQSIVQKAREERLEYIQLHKEIQKKDILLHCIVHDLAGPLTAIIGSLAFLQEEELTPDGKEFLKISLRQAHRQQLMIQQILDIFAAEMGAIESFARDPAHAPDAARCAQEVVKALSPAAAACDVKLQMAPDVALVAEWQVVGEPSRLERVIFNLVENALRHSPAGSLITVALEQAGEDVLVAVDDQGPGVSPDVVGSLFEKFSQGQGQKGKAGLGLYFCRITVEYWGGVIGCTPRPAGGTRFWFRLPRPTSY